MQKVLLSKSDDRIRSGQLILASGGLGTPHHYVNGIVFACLLLGVPGLVVDTRFCLCFGSVKVLSCLLIAMGYPIESGIGYGHSQGHL